MENIKKFLGKNVEITLNNGEKIKGILYTYFDRYWIEDASLNIEKHFKINDVINITKI
jgi:exo-beta-1,3-glucanase (GH17 family)